MAKLKTHRIFAGEAVADAPVTLSHQRIFILPTQRGLGFGLLILLLLLIAFVYGNNLVYLLAFLLAGVFVVTILHSFNSLAGLVLQKGPCKPVFAGDSAAFTLHVNNPGAGERHGLEITLERPVEVELAARAKTSVILYSGTRKRGWHQAGKVIVSSTFPLGLFRAWSPLRFDFKVLVYPKPAAQDSPFPDSSSPAGGQGSGKKGSEEFYGIKEYQAGDAIKHIHWKAMAKGQGVYSKQYSSDSGDELWLDYAATQGHDVEERLSQLCRWIISAEQANLRYGFRLPGLTLQPANGLTHYQQCLETLALF